MSIKALDWAMDTPLTDPLAKLVLICIANHHNPSHGFAWPSVGHLQHITGASEATIRRKLKKLEQIGLIARKHRTGRSTEYHLAFDTPVTVTPLSHRQDTPVTVSPITLKEPLNINRGKIKVCDWEPDDADKQFAKDNGYDWQDVLQSIKLWSKQNGDKAAYVNVSAFWQNWIRRDKGSKPASRQKQCANPIDPRESSRKWAVDNWGKLSDNMRDRYKHHRPDVLAELKKQGIV